MNASGYGVMDIEKSLCGDCIHAQVCTVPLRIFDIGDGVFDLRLRVVVTECKAYKKLVLETEEGK